MFIPAGILTPAPKVPPGFPEFREPRPKRSKSLIFGGQGRTKAGVFGDDVGAQAH